MNYRPTIFAMLLLASILLSACGIGTDGRSAHDVERDKFDNTVAEATKESLVPILPPDSKTLGFSERETGVFSLTLQEFEEKDGMLFTDEVALVCVAHHRTALVESCQNNGRKGKLQERSNGYVYIAWTGTDPDLEIDVGSNSGSLQSAFDTGWDTWLSP